MTPGEWAFWQLIKTVISLVVAMIFSAFADWDLWSGRFWIVAVIVFLLLSGIAFFVVRWKSDDSGGGGSGLDIDFPFIGD